MQAASSESDLIEIDLSKILLPLFKRWRLIVGLALLGTLAGILFTFISPSRFEATSYVAIVNTRTEVQFDQRIRTLSPDDVGSVNDARRNALVGLAANADIARKAIERFGPRLTTLEQDPAELLKHVKGETITRGDLLLIRVQQPDAQLAAEIATFWAQEYETLVNGLYSGNSQQYLEAVRSELVRARTSADATQEDYRKFLAESRVDELRLKISDRAKLLDSLEAIRTSGSLASLGRTQTALEEVNAVSAAQQRIGRLRAIAQSMRDQVNEGGDAAAASNAIPLINLKLEVYNVAAVRTTRAGGLDEGTTSQANRTQPNAERASPQESSVALPGTSLQIQTQADAVGTTAEAQVRDIDALLKSLDTLEKALVAAGQRASASGANTAGLVDVANPDLDGMITKTAAELREARAELDDQEQRLARLRQARDTGVSTLTSLNNKLAELEVSNAVSNREVRFVSEAYAPANRITSRLIPIGIGLGIGLLLGILAAAVIALRKPFASWLARS
jgi:capsular polysaccharide biosynthesis protein